MSDGLSDYLRDAFLNELLRNTNFAPPGTIYASLHTASPGATGLNELLAVDNPGYAREPVSTTGSFAAPAASDEGGREAVSAVDITFDTPTANWTSLFTHFGFWDALTAGNFLFGGLIDAAGVQALSGQPLFIPAGTLVVVFGSELA